VLSGARLCVAFAAAAQTLAFRLSHSIFQEIKHEIRNP
jgi:hypothetical protein